MTKICHITSVHIPLDQRIFYKECMTLQEHGYETYLIVPTKETTEVNGIKIVGAGIPNSRMNRILGFQRKIYKKALEIDAKIYHIHDPELLTMALKLKRKGKKVIFDSHENYYLQIKEKHYIPKILRNTVAKLYYYYETYVVKKLDAAIVPCTFSDHNIFDGRAKETIILPNYPKLSEMYYKYTENAIKQDYVCYIGGLTADRGIKNLIKGSYKSKTRLMLAGKFIPESYQKEVESIEEYACVDYFGFANRVDIVEICLNSIAGMSTILNVGQYNSGDTFGVKIYEYMSLGLPVILSDSLYARKIKRKYDFCITVNPDEPDEISKAIEYIKNNPTEAEKMAINARKAIIKEFNWEIVSQKLVNLYKVLDN